MKAIILAAGKGSRLGSITSNFPKPMICYKGKPILEHNIELCKTYGIKDIYINLHHHPEHVTSYFGNGENWGVNIGNVIGMGALFAKLCFFIFFFMWIRWTIPRFRYDQLMNLGWKILIPLAVINIVITGIVMVLFN